MNSFANFDWFWMWKMQKIFFIAFQNNTNKKKKKKKEENVGKF